MDESFVHARIPIPPHRLGYATTLEQNVAVGSEGHYHCPRVACCLSGSENCGMFGSDYVAEIFFLAECYPSQMCRHLSLQIPS